MEMAGEERIGPRIKIRRRPIRPVSDIRRGGGTGAHCRPRQFSPATGPKKIWRDSPRRHPNSVGAFHLSLEDKRGAQRSSQREHRDGNTANMSTTVEKVSYDPPGKRRRRRGTSVLTIATFNKQIKEIESEVRFFSIHPSMSSSGDETAPASLPPSRLVNLAKGPPHVFPNRWPGRKRTRPPPSIWAS